MAHSFISSDLQSRLRQDKALVFRITHKKNIPWILRNGLHCRSATTKDPNFIRIGDPTLIGERESCSVPIPPKGRFGDYVPFYFTPRSPMLMNIETGSRGITQVHGQNIVFLVSSLTHLRSNGLKVVFTDSHANSAWVSFYSDIDDLDKVDWPLLRTGKFLRSPEDPGRLNRYMAEAMAHEHVPCSALLGLACYNAESKRELDSDVAEANLKLSVAVKRDWYFR